MAGKGDEAEIPSESAKSGKILRVGLIADVQFADIDDRPKRHYRGTLSVVEHAVEFFNTHSIDFVLHAGDIVDMANALLAANEMPDDFLARMPERSVSAINEVMKRLSRTMCKEHVFAVGNHELHNFLREELLRGIQWENGTLSFGRSGAEDLWYDFCPCEGWRCVVLDAYAHSMFSQGRGTLDQEALGEVGRHLPAIAAYADAHPSMLDVVCQDNPLKIFMCDVFEGVPEGPDRRWAPHNGALGSRQMAWLRDVLEAAGSHGERVIIVTHVLVHPESTNGGRGEMILWDYDKLLDILHSSIGTPVQFVISGHQHDGGFYTDNHGIHYIVLESPLQTTPGMQGCFLIAEATDTSLNLVGYCNSDSLLFPGVNEGSLGQRRLGLRCARRDKS